MNKFNPCHSTYIFKQFHIFVFPFYAPHFFCMYRTRSVRSCDKWRREGGGGKKAYGNPFHQRKRKFARGREGWGRRNSQLTPDAEMYGEFCGLFIVMANTHTLRF